MCVCIKNSIPIFFFIDFYDLCTNFIMRFNQLKKKNRSVIQTSSENFGILSFGWKTTTTSLVAFGFNETNVFGNTDRIVLFCKHCVDGVIVRLKSTVAKLLLVIRTARFSFSLTLTTPRLTLRSLGFNTSTLKNKKNKKFFTTYIHPT